MIDLLALVGKLVDDSKRSGTKTRSRDEMKRHFHYQLIDPAHQVVSDIMKAKCMNSLILLRLRRCELKRHSSSDVIAPIRALCNEYSLRTISGSSSFMLQEN